MGCYLNSGSSESFSAENRIQAPVLNREKRSVYSLPHPWWPLFSHPEGRSTGPTWEGMSPGTVDRNAQSVNQVMPLGPPGNLL